MRFMMMIAVSLFMLASCSTVRAVMVKTMDVVTAPYHAITADKHYDAHDSTIN